MTGWRKRTIMEMAREVKMPYDFVTGEPLYIDKLEAFAEFVRADERNRTWTQEHWTEYERSIAAQEREACAKQLDALGCDHCAAAITAIKEALAQPTSGDYALGYCEGFNDACKPKPAQPAPMQEPIGSVHVDTLALIPTLRYTDGGAKLWPAHKAKYDTSYVLVYTTPPAQPAHVPVEWMEMVTANLVREGVNKHKARELAEHFYSLGLAQRTWVGLTDKELEEFSDAKLGSYDLCLEVEAKLKEKNFD